MLFRSRVALQRKMGFSNAKSERLAMIMISSSITEKTFAMTLCVFSFFAVFLFFIFVVISNNLVNYIKSITSNAQS